ncbi:hypothetical protein NJ7G_3783 [Natrinema sp. J7-2]|nr:hypothetical protein NJ7G_3783 [Natrinema sp. J7-2]
MVVIGSIVGRNIVKRRTFVRTVYLDRYVAERGFERSRRQELASLSLGEGHHCRSRLPGRFSPFGPFHSLEDESIASDDPWGTKRRPVPG